MVVGVMQPYFMPYIGYFQLINSVDKFVIYDDVNFIKKGWINRNRILINGKDFKFHIPLKAVSQNKLINEIEIDNSQDWQKKLLKTIHNSYRKAPFYSESYPLLETIIRDPSKSLTEFITNSLKLICEYYSVHTEIIISSELPKNNSIKGQDKIIEICNILGATKYVNPINGKSLYDYSNFLEKNISLSFLKSKPISYDQFNDEFVSWLSLIDIMMFNSPKMIRKFLEQYELI